MANEYIYTQKNLLTYPEKYMYPKFQGKSFLKAWIEDRIEFCSLPNSKPLLPSACSLDMQLCETEEFLYSIVMSNQFPTEEQVIVIEGLLRRFEISKKLPSKLVHPVFSINNDAIIRPLAYACLSLILSRSIEKQINFRYLNCILKLNDLLSSIENLCQDTHKIAKEAVLIEINSVASLFGEGDV